MTGKKFQEKVQKTNELVQSIKDQFEEEVDMEELDGFFKQYPTLNLSLDLVVDNLKKLITGYERKEYLLNEKEYNDVLEMLKIIALNIEAQMVMDGEALDRIKIMMFGTAGVDNDYLLKEVSNRYPQKGQGPVEHFLNSIGAGE
jgi:hypothetical protein